MQFVRFTTIIANTFWKKCSFLLIFPGKQEWATNCTARKSRRSRIWKKEICKNSPSSLGCVPGENNNGKIMPPTIIHRESDPNSHSSYFSRKRGSFVAGREEGGRGLRRSSTSAAQSASQREGWGHEHSAARALLCGHWSVIIGILCAPGRFYPYLFFRSGNFLSFSPYSCCSLLFPQ